MTPRPPAAPAETETSTDLPEELAIPRDAEGPIFSAPWEGQIFAAAVSLRETKLLPWSDFAAYLGREIHGSAGSAARGDYYRHWLDALEHLLIDRGLASAEELARVRASLWAAARHQHAARHGQEPHDH